MDVIPPRNNSGNSVPPAPNSAPNPSYPPAPPIQPRVEADDDSKMRSVISTVVLLLTAFGIAFFLNSYIVQSYQVDGQSMEHTLQNDDRLIVNKIPRTISRITHHQYVPKRYDIIIFNQDGLPGFVGQKQLIKRVIGLPGERVVVNNGQITVYNSQFPGGFNPDAGKNIALASRTTVGNVDITLQKDEIFVCGDNRPNSEDSRYFGPIKTNQVVAKLLFRIMPLNKAEKF